MRTDKRAGYISIMLEEQDFLQINWRSYLNDLKRMIPPNQREYDGEHKTWRVDDTPHNEQVWGELYKKYFESKDQLRLFE